MRYMCLWRPGKAANPPEKVMAEMTKFIDETTRSGQLVLTGGWSPQSPATTIRNAGGKISVTDGPYAEAKEMIGGFALLECKSLEEAIELGRRFVQIAGDGTSEIRALGGPAC